MAGVAAGKGFSGFKGEEGPKANLPRLLIFKRICICMSLIFPKAILRHSLIFKQLTTGNKSLKNP